MSLTPDIGIRPRVRESASVTKEAVVSRVTGTAVADAVRLLGFGSVFTDVLNRMTGPLLPDEAVFRIDGKEWRFRISTRFEYESLSKYRTGPDRRVLQHFVRSLRDDDVVWDVGAHVGVFSVLAAGQVPAGTVIAIEPLPENAEQLRENLKRNGRDATVRQLALDDESGRAELGVNSPSGAGAFGTLNGLSSRRRTTVQTDCGDSLVADGVPAPTVLKVDVQGAELNVLRGLQRSLLDCRVVCVNVYEKHFTRGDEGEEIRDILESSGLHVERLTEWDGGHFLWGTRES
ncbi:FkbM family methyltransferase [Halogeometricum borinquense]|uniref:FkbM family methyltransferase n=1 Tax=Halogeometricum borinquense TaxID=60847 RepID=A0A6C0UES1_9EURY|nr:FkbM family methyltransferase [Halogeometricum borinquense]QIB73932.1 FkbM family methyltransferase [Halogeometricum borinquense]